jgi:hypothetical protein
MAAFSVPNMSRACVTLGFFNNVQQISVARRRTNFSLVAQQHLILQQYALLMEHHFWYWDSNAS